MPTELQTFPFDYEKDYGEQLACAFHNKRYISEEVCEHIRYESDDNLEHEDRRWCRCVTAIFEYKGKYYGIDYDQGLTECQENQYWKQIPQLYKRREITRYTYDVVKEGTDDDKT